MRHAVVRILYRYRYKFDFCIKLNNLHYCIYEMNATEQYKNTISAYKQHETEKQINNIKEYIDDKEKISMHEYYNITKKREKLQDLREQVKEY